MKRFKSILILLCCLCLSFGVFAVAEGIHTADGTLPLRVGKDASVTEGVSGDTGDAFNKKLTSLMRRYEMPDTVDTSLPENRFALCRLLVNGFKGNTYGAVDYAYDSENDYCVLQYRSAEEAESAYHKLQADGVVADPDVYLTFDEETDAHQPFTYDTKTGAVLGLPTYLNDFYMTPEEVVIGLIDTGVMYDCPGLENRFVSHGKDLSGDECEDAYYDTELATDFYGHATFISGIIADNTADNVKILPYKTVQFGHSGPSAAVVVAAVNDAVKSGVDVINISMHSSNNINAINSAVKNATGKGICVCASAGNGGVECDAYPACSPEAITVSALAPKIDYERKVYSYTPFDEIGIADYSNYGDAVDFAAPGLIRSITPSPDGVKTTAKAGTSFSTPLIACACAEIKSMNKSLTKKEVYDILVDCCVDKGDSGKDPIYGNGVPVIANITYSDAEHTYEYRLPQGTLAVHGAVDYTAETQPWRLFADKLMSVTVDSDIERIGDYNFYNVSKAQFTCPQELVSIGDYAFYNCQTLSSYTFTIDAERVGYRAFGDIDDFEIYGYRNTPAESYALSDGIPFHILGCRHNYIYEVVDPTATESGYTVYTCTVCGDSYIGPYIEPVLLESGQCGDNLTYSLYDSGKLVLEGTGRMYSYFEQEAPWHSLREQIHVLQLTENVEDIDAFAFYGCCNLVKICCDANNPYLYVHDQKSLIRREDSSLLLTAARNEFVIPDAVRTLKAQAFICTGNISVTPNSCFTVDNGLLYDSSGNLVMALPSYADNKLVLQKSIAIQENAFILTPYPKRLEVSVLSMSIAPHAIGYYYNGQMEKNALVIKGSSESDAYAYADENGFSFESDNLGRCGENITWRYNSASTTLTLYGSGDMYDYIALNDIPWHPYLNKVTTVQIADDISAVSMYAFYNATALTRLTMPLSLAAPEDDTTWKGCTNITDMTLTYGTGYMDDYILDDGTGLYKYTPWYLSRAKITAFSLDESVKYIGQQAFRACSATKELTLKSVETIADNAFLANAYLKKLTILSRDAEISDYSFFFAYLGGKYTLYKSLKVYAYDDSTAHDYAKAFLNEDQYISLGCGHSRYVTVLEELTDEQGRLYRRCYCEDCGEEYVTMAANTVTLYVTASDGTPLSGAEVCIGTTENLVTDVNGKVRFGLSAGGAYPVSVACHGTVLYRDTAVFDGEVLTARAVIRYGDFVPDGVINAKDYAYVLQKGYREAALFDYGRLQEGDSYITVTAEGGDSP